MAESKPLLAADREFIQVETELFKDRRLNASAIAVYGVIAAHAWGAWKSKYWANPSVPTIVKMTELNQSTVYKALCLLSETGWIHVGKEPFRDRLRNKYYLLKRTPQEVRRRLKGFTDTPLQSEKATPRDLENQLPLASSQSDTLPVGESPPRQPATLIREEKKERTEREVVSTSTRTEPDGGEAKTGAEALAAYQGVPVDELKPGRMMQDVLRSLAKSKRVTHANPVAQDERRGSPVQERGRPGGRRSAGVTKSAMPAPRTRTDSPAPRRAGGSPDASSAGRCPTISASVSRDSTAAMPPVGRGGPRTPAVRAAQKVSHCRPGSGDTLARGTFIPDSLPMVTLRGSRASPWPAAVTHNGSRPRVSRRMATRPVVMSVMHRREAQRRESHGCEADRVRI